MPRDHNHLEITRIKGKSHLNSKDFPKPNIIHSSSLTTSLEIAYNHQTEAYKLSKIGKLEESKEAFAKSIGIYTDSLKQIDSKTQDASRIRNIRSDLVRDMKKVEQAINAEKTNNLFNVGFADISINPSKDEKEWDQFEEQFVSRISSKNKLADELSVDEIVGLESAKSELRTAIEFNQVFPEYATDAKTRIVLYGPPGTGKTALAKAFAKDMDAIFMNVSSDQLVSKYFGEPRQKVNAMFSVAKKKQKDTGKPVIIFLDEVDDIAKSRDDPSVHEATKGILNRIIAELDGFNNADSKNITVIASTNKPWKLDSAFLQRMDQAIYADVPNDKERLDILKIHIKKMLKQKDFAGVDKNVDLKALASLTDGYAGRELKKILDSAKKNVKDEMMTIYVATGKKSKLRPVNQTDFDKALEEIKPSTNANEIRKFELFSISSKKKK